MTREEVDLIRANQEEDVEMIQIYIRQCNQVYKYLEENLMRCLKY